MKMMKWSRAFLVLGVGIHTNGTKLFAQYNPVVPPGLQAPAPAPVAPKPQAPTFPTPLLTQPFRQPSVYPPPPPAPTQPASYLQWDADSKEYNAKIGEPSAHFTFYLTNVSKEVVLINSVHTSCGCTVAQLPSQPWKLAPGTNGPINVTVNLAGKSGPITKSVTVDSSTGTKALLVKVKIPVPTNTIAGVDIDRMRNMQMALADRQAVFKGDCAKCHAEPAKGQTGERLYAAACANCHDSPQRAALVPDLKKLNHPTNAEHWKKWIASGRTGSMMPAFAKTEGGPLDDGQVESLVKYLLEHIPSAPQAAAITARPPVISRIVAGPPPAAGVKVHDAGHVQ